MGKKIKKGTKGDAAKYVTRSIAIKKLNLSLKEFRRLCILKGIFPKEPKRKFKGQNKTYYLLKDIRFLSHEKLINKFRQINAFRKKIRKAKAKHMKFDEKRLKKNLPKYNITHIIKERYPRFTDALNDLDDALSLVNLFNILPKHDLHNITSDMTDISKRLMREFNLYLALSQGIKRAFISVKGFYLNTEIMGVDIIWLVPFTVPQKLPFDVDYEVMTSFLELYHNLMKFVNFKLFKDLNIEYPPPTNNIDLPFFGYNSKEMGKLQAQIKEQIKNDETQKEDEEQLKLLHSEEYKKMLEKKERNIIIKELFKPYVFYISREVPREIISLIIASCGGQFGDSSDESVFEETDLRITHYIVDRPAESIKKIANKEYIQPQWIVDCLNNAKILPTSDYAPQRKITVKDQETGKMRVELSKLPPHISPFYEHSNDEEFGYKTKNVNRAIEEDDEDEDSEKKDEEKTKEDDKKINKKTIKVTKGKEEKDILGDEVIETKVNNESKKLRELLLSKNKKKKLEKIREENKSKVQKRKI